MGLLLYKGVVLHRRVIVFIRAFHVGAAGILRNVHGAFELLEPCLTDSSGRAAAASRHQTFSRAGGTGSHNFKFVFAKPLFWGRRSLSVHLRIRHLATDLRSLLRRRCRKRKRVWRWLVHRFIKPLVGYRDTACRRPTFPHLLADLRCENERVAFHEDQILVRRRGWRDCRRCRGIVWIGVLGKDPQLSRDGEDKK